MEWIHRVILFILGFIAASSIVIADDRMAMNYVYSSTLDLNQEVREIVLAMRERWEGVDQRQEWDPQMLEAFVTQKI